MPRKRREDDLAYYRARYWRKRDEILAKRRAEYEANRDQKRARNRAYYAQHRDTILTQQRTYKNRYPAHRARYWREWYGRKYYGTPNPICGQEGIDGRKYREDGCQDLTHDHKWLPKPAPAPRPTTTATTRRAAAPKKPTSTRASASPVPSKTTVVPALNASPAKVISTPKHDIWHPSPVNTTTAPARRPTTYLCPCGIPGQTARHAAALHRTHLERIAVTP